MLRTRILLTILFLLLTITWISSVGRSGNDRMRVPVITQCEILPVPPASLQERSAAALAYAKVHHLDQRICFLVDMHLASGNNRFFVYDMQKDSLLHAGLVAHGNCYQRWLEGRRYSNQVESGCTSLGRYRVGASYTGKFGLSYKIYGLDSSNSNAYRRTVVLHGHSCVPNGETEDEICQSNGCPTVSPEFLKVLSPIIQHAGKPLLLWIYE